MGNVTISTEEWDTIRDSRRELEHEIVKLKDQLQRATENADVTGSITSLNKSVRFGLEVVRFAVSNLPPETIRNWPSGALREVAHRLVQLPDHTVDDDALRTELLTFADEIDAIERERARKGLRNSYVKPTDEIDIRSHGDSNDGS